MPPRLPTPGEMPGLEDAWGGVRAHGGEVGGGMFMVGRTPSPAEVKAMYDAMVGGPREVILGLRAYIEEPCMVIRGSAIPRRVLLKYVFHKIGGDHFDPSRGTSDEDRLYRLLDHGNDELRVGDRRSVYAELLSTGNAVVASDDVKALYRRIGELEGS